MNLKAFGRRVARASILDAGQDVNIALPNLALLDLVVDRLQAADLPRLTVFCVRCTDFFELVEGEPASPKTAAEILDGAPPGVPPERKYVLGLSDTRGLVGVVDLIDGYPAARDWYVGLFILAPEVRGRGLGRAVWNHLEAWVRGRGGRAVRLIVQTQNPRAKEFWGSLGFVLESEGQQVLPARTNRVWKLRKDLE